MTVTVRFAPSPTGLIHIGNARTALLNWLFAKSHGGTFILRFDDTDRQRSTDAFAGAISEDLAWLGMHPDRIERQSQRFTRYDEIAEQFKTAGLLYPAYETPDELERKRKRQLARGRPPVYDRAALDLTADQVRELEADGRTPHWRFKLPEGTIEWTDLVRGPQSIDLSSLSDPVLIRGDGTYLYTLPSVIDDADMGVTHVIRGEDHVVNTAVQIAVFNALGHEAPQFGHHSLLVGADGKGLSKRLGSLSIAGLRESGMEAMAVASHAALIGTSDAIEPHSTLQSLAEGFDLAKLSRAPGRFDENELKTLNSRLLHELPFADVEQRLSDLEISGGEPFWNAVRGNLVQLRDAAEWWQVVHDEIVPAVGEDDREYVSMAREELPAEPWDETTWKQWTTRLKEVSGRKGKPLFMPLRLALTGLDHGPELAALLPLIGRDKVLTRLS